MPIVQQILTVIGDGKIESINNTAQKMIKDMVVEIKKNAAKRVDGCLIFEIKPSAYILPKSISEEKSKTRWEKFAEEKGIKRKRKSRMIFSEKYNKWMPRYGSRSEHNMELQGGVVEVEQSMSKLLNEKRKRIKKNKENAAKNRDRKE